MSLISVPTLLIVALLPQIRKLAGLTQQIGPELTLVACRCFADSKLHHP